MKLLRWAFIAWAVCASLIAVLAILSTKLSPQTETHTFCAYGRIFVEFEEDGKRWGTIMLDYEGKPIPCREDSNNVKIENTI